MHGRCLRHYRAPDAQAAAQAPNGSGPIGETGETGETGGSGKLDGLANKMNYIFMYRDEEGWDSRG